MGFLFPATMIAIAATVVLTIASQNGVVEAFAQFNQVFSVVGG